MHARTLTPIDRIVGEIDKAIKVLWSAPRSSRNAPTPGAAVGAANGELVLEEVERQESCRLMRVNHSGEVAAQALYQGQALTSKGNDLVEAMRRAAAEEGDHLAWCDGRLKELHGRTSLLNPLWYLGSFAIGALAGALPRSVGLGFVTETEAQVESHLRGHLERLPAADQKSRAIVEQMRRDEVQHGAQAASLGGAQLPLPLRVAMRLTARVMTHGSYWL